ncbi:UDP-glucose 4-epimerase GalE [Rhizobium paknamense]|uniref:UDP-glucose 4-epimerase n=1 Tax=Rhizobium paknamense TaxID=1206817 RepID=A0ABU0IFB2_9HYPH|nr:UDP-glucose 4-epimerase GalE [Rhizobium paknamense]MDQ0456933.1 UDP-glucose 4-epimerase [Rhizobium paknamense]
MAILVTGGAGYIGSHMVWALLDAGHEVVVIDRLSTGFRSAVAPAARFYLGDIAERAVLQQIFLENRVEAVLHFAGSAVVPDSIRDPLGYYRNNTLASQVLIEETVRAGIGRFIFSSTAAVYGTPQTDQPVKETAEARPENPYGRSKLMTEAILADTARAQSGFRFVALRYFNVAGAERLGRVGQSTRSATHLIKVACEAALGKRSEISVFGQDFPTPDGTGVRDYIHVDDLVQAHLKALHYLVAGGESLTVNCGYGRGASVLEVLQAVERVAQVRLPVTFAPRRPGDAASVVADTALARAVLGWSPPHPGLEAIILSAFDWERRFLRDRDSDIDALQQRLAASGF